MVLCEHDEYFSVSAIGEGVWAVYHLACFFIYIYEVLLCCCIASHHIVVGATVYRENDVVCACE